MEHIYIHMNIYTYTHICTHVYIYTYIQDPLLPLHIFAHKDDYDYNTNTTNDDKC
jgi:hypothetical protein